MKASTQIQAVGNRVTAAAGRATRCSEDRGGVVYIMDDAMSGGDEDTFCGMWSLIN